MAREWPLSHCFQAQLQAAYVKFDFVCSSLQRSAVTLCVIHCVHSLNASPSLEMHTIRIILAPKIVLHATDPDYCPIEHMKFLLRTVFLEHT